MAENGGVWVVNRMAGEIRRYPEYNEELRIITWSRGKRSYEAYREFQVFSGTDAIVTASSVWLYIDLSRGRLARVPDNLEHAYGTHKERAGPELENWAPDAVNPSVWFSATTRAQDMDAVGHVNNTVYFDLVDTLVQSVYDTNQSLSSVFIGFQKEIKGICENVSMGFEHTKGGGRFILKNRNTVFAAGQVQTQGLQNLVSATSSTKEES